ncbi:hypothetical protein L0O81_16345, partial [Oliverpabstia sp. DFI.9.49]|nr:hypothetical protein [Oliverpabstia sp. DFI.9.49]
MKEIVDEFFKDGGFISDDPKYVRYFIKEGAITFVNVPFLTYDDPTDPDWYCLTFEAERVLVAYLRHPLVSRDDDPITLDYET